MTFPRGYRSVVVFPDLAVALRFDEDPRFVNFTKICATDGKSSVDGFRLKEVWIHWWCIGIPAFTEIAAALITNMAFQRIDLEVEQRLFC